MVLQAVKEVKPVEGRMELIKAKQNFSVIIDYCQHINNYEQILSLWIVLDKIKDV